MRVDISGLPDRERWRKGQELASEANRDGGIDVNGGIKFFRGPAVRRVVVCDLSAYCPVLRVPLGLPVMGMPNGSGRPATRKLYSWQAVRSRVNASKLSG